MQQRVSWEVLLMYESINPRGPLERFFLYNCVHANETLQCFGTRVSLLEHRRRRCMYVISLHVLVVCVAAVRTCASSRACLQVFRVWGGGPARV